MKQLVFNLVLVLSFILIGCDTNESDTHNAVNDDNGTKKAAEQIVEGTNNFTFKIFNEIEKKYGNDNIFFSPLSMSVALSMALNGAEGETKQEIKDVIDFGSFTDEEINTAFKGLQDAFQNLDSEVKFSLANSAWYKENYELLENYRKILIDYYGAEIAGLNFSDPASVDLINNWIAHATEDKIKKMISELDPSTVLVLVNAIYFNGSWQHEFDKDLTMNRRFSGLNDEEHECQMMESGKINIKFNVDDNKRIALLPYGSGNFEMVLYMPLGIEMPEFINGLEVAKLNELLNEATEDTAIVYLPKFKIETETISIKEMLINLGMSIPFGDGADFSNIFGAGHSLFISDVFHKAFIKVNEEGTEAAAATVVVIDESWSPDSGITKIFFDQPFVFFIREVSTGEILFAGKLVKPEFEE